MCIIEDTNRILEIVLSHYIQQKRCYTYISFSAKLHEGRGLYSGKKEERLQLAQLGYHSCLVNDKNVTFVI